MSTLTDLFRFTRKSAEPPLPQEGQGLGILLLNSTNLDWSSQETQYANGYCKNAYVKRACDIYAVRVSSVDHIVTDQSGNDITDRKEVPFIKLPDPSMENQRGMSPMRSCAKSIEMQNVIREWNIQVTRNGAKPSVVINSENYLTEEQMNLLKSDLRSGYQGADNAGNAMLLPKGLTASSLGMTAVEMDYQHGMVMAAREIAIAYGIPPEMLADNANKTYSNAQEAAREVVVNTIRPLLDLIYQSLWAFFRDKPIAKGIGKYTYDVEQLTDFMGEQSELYTALQQAPFLTINDKREKLGYDRIDDDLADQVMLTMADVPISEYSSDPLDPGRTDPDKDDLNTLLGGIGL